MIRVEWAVLMAGVAFLVGIVLAVVSAALYIQWEQKLTHDEARWRRIDWQNRLDARRDGHRRWIENKGKAQW